MLEQFFWGLLGAHHPTITDALINRDCTEGLCEHEHEEDCPTYPIVVCGECVTIPEIGEVAFAVDWPCEHAERNTQHG